MHLVTQFVLLSMQHVRGDPTRVRSCETRRVRDHVVTMRATADFVESLRRAKRSARSETAELEDLARRA
jgi:hypothetical protein